MNKRGYPHIIVLISPLNYICFGYSLEEPKKISGTLWLIKCLNYLGPVVQSVVSLTSSLRARLTDIMTYECGLSVQLASRSMYSS